MRAVPAKTIDLIRDGVSGRELHRAGDQAVWSALFKTAASAIQHGWGVVDWEAELDRRSSKLGTQSWMRRGRELSPKKRHDLLRDAWDAAWVWVSERERPFGKDEAQEAARILASEVMVWCSDADAPLGDDTRALLAHIATVADQRGTLTPAVPRRAAAQELGITEHRVRTLIDRLVQEGLLTVATRGTSSGVATKRKATTYRLPSAEARRRYVAHRHGRPPIECSAGVAHRPGHSAHRPGSPVQMWGEGERRVEITVSGDPDAVVQAVRALGGVSGVRVSEVGDGKPDLRLVGGSGS